MNIEQEISLVAKDRNAYFVKNFIEGNDYKVFDNQVWLFGYEVQKKMLKNHKFSTKARKEHIWNNIENEELKKVLKEFYESWVMYLDGEDHKIKRKIVNTIISTNMKIKSKKINEIIEKELSGKLKNSKECDIVKLSSSISTSILSSLLKINEVELKNIIQETEKITNLLYVSNPEEKYMDETYNEILMVKEKIQMIIEDGDYFGNSALKKALKNKTELQKIALITNILIDAYDPLSSLITAIMYRSVNNKEVIKVEPLRFIKEVIRIHAPFTYIARISEEEIMLDNNKISKGTRFVFFISSANIDQRIFPSGTNLNVLNKQASLTFGLDSHRCPGAKIAYIAGEAICKQLADYRHDYYIDEIKFLNNFSINKIEKLVLKRKNNIVFDLDGTLCFDGKTIEDEIKNNIKMLSQKNKIIFASARPIRDIAPLINNDDELKYYDLIGGNGAIIRKDGIIQSESIQSNDSKDVFLKANEKGHHLLVDSEWDYFYNGIEEHELYKKVDSDNCANNVTVDKLDKIIKIVIMYGNNETVEQVKSCYQNIFEKYKINVYEDEKLIDVIPNNVNKFVALKKYFGIEKEQYTAFGNDINDVELLKNAKKGYIVGAKLVLDECEYIKEDEIKDVLEKL